jgi:hypothetical protein
MGRINNKQCEGLTFPTHSTFAVVFLPESEIVLYEHMMYSSLSGASFLIWLLGTAVYNVLMGMAFHPIIYLTNTSTYDGNEGDL